jgi:hypothetical protein
MEGIALDESEKGNIEISMKGTALDEKRIQRTNFLDQRAKLLLGTQRHDKNFSRCYHRR